MHRVPASSVLTSNSLILFSSQSIELILSVSSSDCLRCWYLILFDVKQFRTGLIAKVAMLDPIADFNEFPDIKQNGQTQVLFIGIRFVETLCANTSQ